jgi:ABC-type uncharacterized transport system involved in gliding motility auxiliary subunit
MKLYKGIVFAGLVLILTGLIIYSIANVWSVLALVFIGIGLVATVFALIKLDLRAILKDRRTLYGGNMIIVILLLIAIVGMANFFLARHTWRVDSTEGGTFSLSDQTVKVLRGLNQDVNVIAFFKDVNKGGIEDRLKEYAHYSKFFKWEIVDPDEKPALAKIHKVKSYGSLVVITATRQEQIADGSEQNLTNAIIKVTRGEVKKVAFVTGHGEASINSQDRDGYQRAKNAIEEQNYAVEELRLAELDSISDDVSVLVVAGPKNAFFEHELELITGYLNQGGSALFLLDGRYGISLHDYMLQWQVDVGENLVIDASGFGRLFGQSPDVPLVSSYGDHPIVKEMGSVMTFFPVARSVTPLEAQDDSKISTVPLTSTGKQSFAVANVEEVYGTGKVTFNEATDLKGPVTLACATTKNLDNGRTARIVTVGDSDFASNAYFANQANGDLFMNMISWLLADEDLISIRPKEPGLRLVNLTPAQLKTVFWLTVIILPLISFGIGVMVFVRRK